MKKVVANFEILFTQYLDPLGNVKDPCPTCVQDPHFLIRLYQAMVKTRAFDAKAIKLQRTGKLGTYPSLLGQEAIGVGIGAAMQDRDVFCPYYRDLGTQFWRKIKMKEILLYWGGDERGSSFSDNPVDFPICIPIASQNLHAVGVATAIKLRREPRVVVVVTGDGGTSRGDFYEALNVAGIWQLPIVFIINNNQWAISVSRQEQTKAVTLAQKGVAAGIPSEQIDGNDVVAVYDTVRQGIEKARVGQGPCLIEAITYRMGDHTTADDAKRYRSSSELETHRLEDPIHRLQQYCVNRKIWTDEQEKVLQREITAEIDEAIEEYQSANSDDPEAIFKHLYATLPEALIPQLQECIEFSRKKSDE